MTSDLLQMSSEEGERVQKILARAGIGSRRVCDELVAEGRVTVNGTTVEPGARADPARDHIEVDGARIGTRPGLVYYLLNKPAGVLTTMSDPQGRPTVADLVPDEPRVFPIGRLDADTEGLLLLTNDGDLAQQVAHPSHGIEKEYVAEVAGRPSRGALRQLREGIELEDGRTAPAKVSVTEGPSGVGVVRLTIHEGRNRQVRRMCEAVGHPVRRLVRVRIGSLADRTLAPGSWRELAQAEVRALEREAVAGRRSPGSSQKPGRGGSGR